MGITVSSCSCPIGARPDVAEVDAALQLVGQAGAETLTAIAGRLGVAKATLSRHRTTCLGLEPALAPPPGTGRSIEEHAPAAPAERHSQGDGELQSSGTARERPGTPRSTHSVLQGLPNPKDDAFTSPRKLLVADLERRALELRIRGKTYADISAELGVGEDAAMDMVERVLLRTRGKADALAETARALEVRRCDAIIDSFWDRATDPTRAVAEDPVGEDGATVRSYDPSQDKAGQVLLKAMERRAKLLGLDTPTSGPLVQVNVVQIPGVQNLLRVVVGALDGAAREGLSAVEARARVLEHVRGALGRGAAPRMLTAGSSDA